MSSDYQPKVIFGLKLSEDKIITTSTITNNDCKCNPKINPSLYLDAKYCPYCGNSLHRLSKKYTAKFKDFDDPLNNDSLNIEGWPVTVGTDAEDFYVGFYVQEGVYGHTGDLKCDLPDMSKMEQFKVDMKKVDLWDEKMFGAWIVLYLSC